MADEFNLGATYSLDVLAEALVEQLSESEPDRRLALELERWPSQRLRERLRRAAG